MAVVSATAPQVYEIPKDDAGFTGGRPAPTRNVVVSFDGLLGVGETLVDTEGEGSYGPEVIGASLVTVGTPTIISDPVTTINGKRVTANKAITFTIEAGTVTGTDVQTVWCEASSGEYLSGYIIVKVV